MKVGIVGCGHAADEHLAQLCRLPGIEVVGLCDVDRAQAESVGQRHGVPHAYNELATLLGEQQPDVVHVVTPPRTHCELSVQAMEAGCHVLVEKPMAASTGEATEMADCARDRGVTLGVCHNFLFVPAYVAARRLVGQGILGRVLSAEIYWRIGSLAERDRYETTPWLRELPGGIFHEVAPHSVYLLAELLGGLRVAHAIARMDDSGAGGELRVLLDGDEGLGVMALSRSANPKQKFLRIYGTRMSLHVDIGTSTLVRLRSLGGGLVSRALLNLQQSIQLATGTAGSALRTVAGRMERGHLPLLRRFYEALGRGDRPPVTAEDGVANTATLDCLWEALSSIRPPGSGGRQR